MTSKELSYGILRAVALVAAIFVVLYFLWLIRPIFAYLAIAFVLTMIGRPLMNLMNTKLKIPNIIGAALVICLFFFLILAFTSLFISLVLDMPFRLFENFSHLDRFEESITHQITLLSESLGFLNIPFLSDYVNDAIKNVNFKSFASSFRGSLTSVGMFLVDAFSVVFITFFFLKDRDLINTWIITIAPKGEEARFESVLDTTKNLLSRYFIGLTLQVLIMFTFYFIILLSFGIHYAAVIALLCALLNPLPYVGPVVGGVIMMSLSINTLYAAGMDFQTEIIPKVLWILFWFCLAHLWDNFINQPLIYSRSVKSSPLEIFLVILIGGFLFGIIGIAIAVPVYTVLRVVLKEFFSEYKLVQSITKNL